ncbi:MAG TPA: tetratricopeptide repeat protein, partial [Polyangiaceae bacterium]|nr:tetratricopeptide repeat protein [Polyangiaceae bacterium]
MRHRTMMFRSPTVGRKGRAELRLSTLSLDASALGGPARRVFALIAVLAPIALAACSSTPPPPERPLDADPALSDAGPDAKKGNPELDRGEAFVKSGKFAEALPHLKAAFEADPKNANAAFYLGLATEQTGGDKAEAERLYKQAIALDPKLSEAAQNLAAMYLGDPPRADDAIAVLEPALKNAPDDAALNANLGFAYGL